MLKPGKNPALFSMTVNDRVLIVVLTCLALLLRLWGLNQDLWLDEIATVVNHMRLPPWETLSSFHSANQHLLNSFFGSISIRVLGESAWTVRLPALVFGVATIPVFFSLAMKVTRRGEAVIATLFLTLSYHHVWFSQNARGYTAMIFFTVLSTLLMLRLVQSGKKPSRKNVWWFSLCGVLGLLSLLNYAFVLTGQYITALLGAGTDRRRPLYAWLPESALIIMILTLLGYMAALPAMLEYFLGGGEQMGWRNPLEFAGVFAQGLIAGLPVKALPVLLLLGVITISGWFSYLRSQRTIALMLLLPVLLNLVALAVLSFGAYPRSFLYILPFGILVLVRGAFVLGGHFSRLFSAAPRLQYVLPLLLLTASALLLPFNYLYPKQDYTGALDYTRSQAGPGDNIVAVGYLASGYKSYYAPELAFPKSAAQLAALDRRGSRTWVLYSFTRDMRRHFPDIQDYLEREFQIHRKFPGTLGDGTIYLAVSPPPE